MIAVNEVLCTAYSFRLKIHGALELGSASFLKRKGEREEPTLARHLDTALWTETERFSLRALVST